MANKSNKLEGLISTNQDKIKENRNCILKATEKYKESTNPEPKENPYNKNKHINQRNIILFESRSLNQAFISTNILFLGKPPSTCVELARRNLGSQKKLKELLKADDIFCRVIQGEITLQNVESFKNSVHDELSAAGIKVLSLRATRLPK